MAIQEPYIYRLVYMLFFLYSAITFQVCLSVTREQYLLMIIE